MIDRYTLTQLMASGGMGSVYLGEMEGAGGFRKRVAVKTIHPHLALNNRFVEMFLHEARVAARIEHPNVCAVIDCGTTEDNICYLAMEYLDGVSLSALVIEARRQSARIPVRVALRIVCDSARGLHAAHELRGEDGSFSGLVHRDVSPANLFVLTSGFAKVLDFGVARSLGELGEWSVTGEVKGKIAYMAPEQVRTPKLVDRRADVWSLGVVLWELLTGRRLFTGETDAARLRLMLSSRIVSPSDIDPTIPRELSAIVLRALERDLSKRTPTALDLVQQLEALAPLGFSPATTDDVAIFAALLRDTPERNSRPSKPDAPLAEATTEPSAVMRLENVKSPVLTVEDPSLSDVAPVIELSLVSEFPGAQESSFVSGFPPAGEEPYFAAFLPKPEPTTATTDTTLQLAASSASSAPSAPARRSRSALVWASLGAAMALGGAFAVMRVSQSRVAYAAANTVAAAHPAAPAAARSAPPALAPVVAPAAPALIAAPEPTIVNPVVAPAVAPAAARPAVRANVVAPAPAVAVRVAPQGPAAAGGSASASNGFLTILGSADVDVFEGSHRLGALPLMGHALPAGAHQLELRRHDGVVDDTFSVTITSFSTTMLRLRSE